MTKHPDDVLIARSDLAHLEREADVRLGSPCTTLYVNQVIERPTAHGNRLVITHSWRDTSTTVTGRLYSVWRRNTYLWEVTRDGFLRRTTMEGRRAFSSTIVRDRSTTDDVLVNMIMRTAGTRNALVPRWSDEDVNRIHDAAERLVSHVKTFDEVFDDRLLHQYVGGELEGAEDVFDKVIAEYLRHHEGTGLRQALTGSASSADVARKFFGTTRYRKPLAGLVMTVDPSVLASVRPLVHTVEIDWIIDALREGPDKSILVDHEMNPNQASTARAFVPVMKVLPARLRKAVLYHLVLDPGADRVLTDVARLGRERLTVIAPLIDVSRCRNLADVEAEVNRINATMLLDEMSSPRARRAEERRRRAEERREQHPCLQRSRRSSSTTARRPPTTTGRTLTTSATRAAPGARPSRTPGARRSRPCARRSTAPRCPRARSASRPRPTRSGGGART